MGKTTLLNICDSIPKLLIINSTVSFMVNKFCVSSVSKENKLHWAYEEIPCIFNPIY